MFSLYYWKVKETFTNNNNVNLPINTTSSCLNKCSPGNNSCYITGEQCIKDNDCYGCNPLDNFFIKKNFNVIGDNDAGKLTIGVTPQYSSLTSGYGTHERVITSNMFSKPSMANFGGNMWFSQFESDQDLFDKRYKPSGLQFMPDYPKRYSLTGQFIDDGPFASNSDFF
jgi:hypothetical protein